MKESVELRVVQTFVVAVLKVAQVFQQHLTEEHMTNSLHRARRLVVLEVMHYPVRTRTCRRKREARALARKIYIILRLELTELLKRPFLLQ